MGTLDVGLLRNIIVRLVLSAHSQTNIEKLGYTKGAASLFVGIGLRCDDLPVGKRQF